MIYTHLLPPLEMLYKARNWGRIWTPPYRSSYVLDTANTEILRTNRNIYHEASAVLYRDIMPISIDWNTNDRNYIGTFMLPHNVAFNFAPSDATLPPCVVHVQQEHHDEDCSADRISTILDAADFPMVCSRLPTEYYERLDQICEIRTSYSLISLPRTGYSMDKIRELVWLPLKALQEGRLGLSGKTTHCNRKIIDRTGAFEKTAAMLEWDQESDDGDNNKGKDESDDGDGDDHSSHTDSGDEEDSFDGDSDGGIDGDENSDENDSDEVNNDEGGDEDGNIDSDQNSDENDNNTKGRSKNEEEKSGGLWIEAGHEVPGDDNLDGKSEGC